MIFLAGIAGASQLFGLHIDEPLIAVKPFPVRLEKKMGQSLCLQWAGSAECVTSVGVLCLCVGKLFWFGDILREQLALLVHVCWGVSLGSQTSSGGPQDKSTAEICFPLLMLFRRVAVVGHTIRIHPFRVCSWSRAQQRGLVLPARCP